MRTVPFQTCLAFSLIASLSLSSLISLSRFTLLDISQILPPSPPAPAEIEVAARDKSEALTFSVRRKQHSELSSRIFPS